MASSKSFRELEQQLEVILHSIERGEYGELDDLLADYEAGKKVIAELQKRLEAAKISVVKVAGS